GQQHIEDQPPHGRAGIELLSDRDEGHLVFFKESHQAGKVQQGAAQPVYFVDHHTVHLTGLDIRQELLKRRSLEVAAGEAAVVIAGRQAGPTQGRLALNIGTAGSALSIERGEFLIEPFFGGLAGVEGTANRLNGFGHGVSPWRSVGRTESRCSGYW